MNLYRLAKTKYADDLSGQGGSYGSGRWHREGTQLLYTAQYASLAILEMVGHSDTLPRNYSLITLDLPETACILGVNADALPADWQQTPAPLSLADLAKSWLAEGTHWIMRVPSVHSPVEHNYLLNPLHPEHSTLRIVSIEPHPFDPRLN